MAITLSVPFSQPIIISIEVMIGVLAVLVGNAIIELLCPGTLPQSFTKPVSIAINRYLQWKHPVFDDDGKRVKIVSLPYVWPNGQGDTAKFLSGIENSAAWGKQNGVVYRLWSGMAPEIVLTHPRQLKAVFRDSDKHFKAPANNSGFYMNQLLGQCVGLISGQNWRALRALTEVPFRHAAVSIQIEDFQRRIDEHFRDLHNNSSNLKQNLLHPVDDLAILPFRIVADMLYGRLSPELSKQLEDLIPLRTKIFNEHVIRGSVHRFPWARFLPTTANAELRQFKQAWKEFNHKAVAHARASLKTGGSSAPIIPMFDAVLAQEVTEDQILQTLDESLFANLDVTIGGLSWVPVFLAAHQDAQDRLRSEVNAASDDNNNERRLHDYLLNSKSTFMACCVLESSRLRPLAAFSVPQAAPTSRRVEAFFDEDTDRHEKDIGSRGYNIPAGTSFVIDTYALNVRNEAWGPDNESFRPDRFLQDLRDRRYLFWRFGFGPRQCMGRYAADLIIRMVVAQLIRHYKLEIALSHNERALWVRNRESWITHSDIKLKCIEIRNT